MVVAAFTGNYAGIVVSLPISGLLAETWGWESIFYVFGVVGCIWTVLWLLFIRQSPRYDRFITIEERNYIENSLARQSTSKKVPIPWKAIWTSSAVWAIIAAQFSEVTTNQLTLTSNQTIISFSGLGLLYSSNPATTILERRAQVRHRQIRPCFCHSVHRHVLDAAGSWISLRLGQNQRILDDRPDPSQLQLPCLHRSDRVHASGGFLLATRGVNNFHHDRSSTGFICIFKFFCELSRHCTTIRWSFDGNLQLICDSGWYCQSNFDRLHCPESGRHFQSYKLRKKIIQTLQFFFFLSFRVKASGK